MAGGAAIAFHGLQTFLRIAADFLDGFGEDQRLALFDKVGHRYGGNGGDYRQDECGWKQPPGVVLLCGFHFVIMTQPDVSDKMQTMICESNGADFVG